MDTTTLTGVVLVDNRITELLKRALIARLGASDEVAGVIVLLVSFVVGFGAVLLLPAINLFAGQGSSQVAEFILTGVAIGALANGVDFLGKGVQNVFDRVAPKA